MPTTRQALGEAQGSKGIEKKKKKDEKGPWFEAGKIQAIIKKVRDGRKERRPVGVNLLSPHKNPMVLVLM